MASQAIFTPDHFRAEREGDWARLARRWQRDLDDRRERIRLLRERLTGCIGCGCLSLQRCNLYNKADRLAERGPGARILNVGIPGE